MFVALSEKIPRKYFSDFHIQLNIQESNFLKYSYQFHYDIKGAILSVLDHVSPPKINWMWNEKCCQYILKHFSSPGVLVEG